MSNNNNIDEKILLGRDEVDHIVTIYDEIDPNFFICKGKIIDNILVPKRNCIEINENNIKFECVSDRQLKQETFVNYKNIDFLPINFNFDGYNVYIKIKKNVNELKVIKTTDKTVHFVGEDGKKHYCSISKINEIKNYNIDQEVPVKNSEKPNIPVKEKETVSTTGRKKRGSGKKENPKEYAEAKGRDGDATGGMTENKMKSVETTNKKKGSERPKKKEESKKKTNKKGSVGRPKKKQANLNNKKVGDDFEHIDIPFEVDYRKENRMNVFMDLPDGRVGLHVYRSHGGRVFWHNLETGQKSAISWKKVTKDNNIKVYEYK